MLIQELELFSDNSDILKCSLSRICNGLYLVEFAKNNHYDLCMTFIRYQEKYESPNPRFNGKNFSILDYIEWYSKKHEDCFTYAADWGGFNIPDTMFTTSWYEDISDKNKYDYFMLNIVESIKHDIKYNAPSDKYYIIGSSSCNTTKHEIAHGFYYISQEYKGQMNDLTDKLPGHFKTKIYKWLEDLGYSQESFIDEMQAYMSSGFPDGYNISPGKLNKPYQNLFKNYQYLIDNQKSDYLISKKIHK